MCKIMIMSGVKDETRELAWQLTLAMADKMSTNDRDGLGYAAVSSNGSLFAERWLKNSDAFRERSILTELDKEMITKYGSILKASQKYDYYGNISDNAMTSITLHARMATSGREFFNTHPFIDEATETTLIHNGVISNVNELEYKISTCDSEGILNLYIKHGVANAPANIQKVASKLDGYYACGVFAKTADGRRILDVFKDERASLWGVMIKELGTLVFSTSLEYIERSCNQLNLTILSKYEIRPGVMLRVDAVTGEVIGTFKFNPEYKGSRKGGGSRGRSSSNYGWSGSTKTPASGVAVAPGKKSAAVEVQPEGIGYGDLDLYGTSSKEKSNVVPIGETDLGHGWSYEDGSYYQRGNRRGDSW